MIRSFPIPLAPYRKWEARSNQARVRCISCMVAAYRHLKSTENQHDDNFRKSPTTITWLDKSAQKVPIFSPIFSDL